MRRIQRQMPGEQRHQRDQRGDVAAGEVDVGGEVDEPEEGHEGDGGPHEPAQLLDPDEQRPEVVAAAHGLEERPHDGDHDADGEEGQLDGAAGDARAGRRRSGVPGRRRRRWRRRPGRRRWPSGPTGGTGASRRASESAGADGCGSSRGVVIDTDLQVKFHHPAQPLPVPSHDARATTVLLSDRPSGPAWRALASGRAPSGSGRTGGVAPRGSADRGSGGPARRPAGPPPGAGRRIDVLAAARPGPSSRRSRTPPRPRAPRSGGHGVEPGGLPVHAGRQLLRLVEGGRGGLDQDGAIDLEVDERVGEGPLHGLGHHRLELRPRRPGRRRGERTNGDDLGGQVLGSASGGCRSGSARPSPASTSTVCPRRSATNALAHGRHHHAGGPDRVAAEVCTMAGITWRNVATPMLT